MRILSGARIGHCAAAVVDSTLCSTTIRTETYIVVLDVLVTDKAGTPIHGLTDRDFTVREDGRPQTVQSVDEHSGATASPALPAAAPDVHTNQPAGGADVWNVVLFDQFNTLQADQQRARTQLVKFANTLSPHANVALISFGGGLRIVSPFRAGQPGMVQTLAKGALQFHAGPLLQPYNADEQYDLEQYIKKLPTQGAPGTAALAVGVRDHTTGNFETLHFAVAQ